MLKLDRFISVAGVNANAPEFVRYWDLRSSLLGINEKPGISPRDQQPKQFADL